MAILGTTVINGNLDITGKINGYILNTASQYPVDSTITADAPGIPDSAAVIAYVQTAIQAWITANSRNANNITFTQNGATLTANVASGYYPGNPTTKSITLDAATITPSVNSLTKPQVAYSATANGFTASPSATAYYVSYGGTITAGSVKAKETHTAGYIVSNGNSLSDASTINVTESNTNQKIYIPEAQFSYVSSSDGSQFISCSTAGYCPTGTISPSNTNSMDILAFTLDKAINFYGSSAYDGSSVNIVTTEPSTKSNVVKLSFSVPSLDPGYIMNSTQLLNNIANLYIPALKNTVSIQNLTGPTVNLGLNANGIVLLDSGTSDFSITPTGTNTAGSVSAKSVIALKDTNYGGSGGIIATGTTNAASASAINASIPAGTTKYIQAAVLSNTQTSYTQPTLTITKDTSAISTTETANAYKITIEKTQTNGSISVNASASTEGYLKNQTQSFTKNDIGINVTNNAGDIYITPAQLTLGAAVTGTSTNGLSGTNATLEDTNNSGIAITATANVKVHGTANVSTEGYITSSSNGSSSDITETPEKTQYLKEITIPSEKSLNKINNSGTISSISNSGTFTNFSGAGTISNLWNTLTVTRIGTNIRTGTLNITNNGYNSTYIGTVSITTNTYGTVNVWGSSGDKTVQVVNHTVTADGTTVTDSNGDLITISPLDTYYTTTNTGYGNLGIGWNSSQKYIKSGSVSANSGAISAASGITLSDYLTTTSIGNYGGFNGSGQVSVSPGWVATNGSVSSNNSSTYYIKAGVAHNSYITTAGWIETNEDAYTLSYDSNDKCVYFVFNDA